MFRSAVQDVRSEDEDDDEDVEMVEGPVETAAARRQRKLDDKENRTPQIQLNGNVVGDGDGSAEKLEDESYEYVDITSEEKKDR